ncbi:hypothetical protein [Streptomyces sp. AB3(2024)]|uniref:hypothetical protein n=1 Tax=Streptomyces sp. AB3(2024) TaxID=3317321 RepID=UPI0035A268F9
MADRVRATEQERLERLRGLLSGQRTQDRAARALTLGQGGSGNMLLGALLHGADRLRQGQTPTDLEQILLNAVGAQLSGAETQQWGRVYRELVDAQGRVALLPERITSRPVTQGYSMADLRQDLPRLQADALACPTVQIVSPAVAASGQPEDPAFIEAMAETGFAVTAFADVTEPLTATGAADAGIGQSGEAPAGGESEDGSRAATTFRMKLEMESFYVNRAVGDQGGGRDEIYWTAATSRGNATGATFVSEEFGAVKKGDRRHFTAGEGIFFDGTSDGYIGTTICCWEADQSNDEWWNALKKALNEAVDRIDEALMIGDYLTGFSVPTWVAISWEIGKLFVSIIDYFRNYDDLSSCRTIGMSRQDLAVLSHRGHTNWHFNGDGYHELRVKYTGEKVPFPAGTLEYVTYTGDTASAPVPLPFKSMNFPALASFKGKLHALFLDASTQGVMWTVLDGQTWSTPVRVHRWRSYFTPAMAVYRGKLYCVLVAADNESGMVWSVNEDGTSWAQTTKSRNTYLNKAPALAAWRDQLWMVHVGEDGMLWENYYDGTDPEWSRSSQHHPWRTDSPVGFTAQGSTLWQATRGKGDDRQDRVDVTYAEFSGGWKDFSSPPGWRVSCGPTLATHNNRLWIFLRNTNGTLVSSTHSGGAWSTTQPVGTGTEIKPMDEVAAATHSNKLYVMYHR